jgi:queuine tRNA-ribosyltransferase
VAGKRTQKLKMFEIKKQKNKSDQRIGLIKTRKGVLKTPVFMPIATKGAVKNLTPEELKELGAELILSNTYHLWLRPGSEVIKKAGGLHKFMNWFGPILTDSGGYQVFSLGEKMGERRDKNSVKITDAGVQFRDPFDGKKHFLTPEKSIEIQLDLGSDIIMVLDECPAFPATRRQVEKAVERTSEWARRCKDFFEKKINSKFQIPNYKPLGPSRTGLGQNSKTKARRNRPLLFGIVQGGIYKDLRQRSVRELLEIGFDGYAIGGVAVGEPREFLQKVLNYVLPLLPENKPHYLMGLGRPEEIVSAVKAGIDMFDCVIPTREARHGRLYKFNTQSSKFKITDKNFYETLQINKAKFARDFKPIDGNCSCYTCHNFSRAYLNHLFRTNEPLALRLATIHNLKFYLELMEGLRK